MGEIIQQSGSPSPTTPSDPLKLLVDRLNDPQLGDALRTQWSIDRAVWTEPVTAVRNGVPVLITPAYADIHTSIDCVFRRRRTPVTAEAEHWFRLMPNTYFDVEQRSEPAAPFEAMSSLSISSRLSDHLPVG